MNYKRAALEQLAVLPPTDKAFRMALVYAILSLGQTDEMEAVVDAAILYVGAGRDYQAYSDLQEAVAALVGEG